jgi:hypothetical protein
VSNSSGKRRKFWFQIIFLSNNFIELIRSHNGISILFVLLLVPLL